MLMGKGAMSSKTLATGQENKLYNKYKAEPKLIGG